MALRITTLGALRIERDGLLLERLPAARLRSALLIHLAVERETTRDAVTGLLWPDRPPERARHLLSQALYELRQELGESWMESAGERLCVTEEVVVDVAAMEEAVEAGTFEVALDLYDGAFLPGGALAVTREMEGWIDSQQARVSRLHRRARRGAIDARVAEGHLPKAVTLARRWVELDPLDDEAQHRLIELLGATGDRSAALRQYDAYARLVKSELDLEPMEETQALIERIREGELGPRSAGPLREEAGPEARRSAEADRPEESPQPNDPGGRADREVEIAGKPAEGLDALLDRVAGLRHRRTVRWTLAYLAVAVVLLEGLDILTELFGLPPQLMRGIALTLGLGAIFVLGAAWYRADQRRPFGKAEAALTLLVAVFLLSMPAWFSRAIPVSASASGEVLSPNRLAVLYFDDTSPDGSLGAMGDGFTESLIHLLSQVDGLDVIPRRAVEPFRADPGVGYDSIVGVLRAGLLVEGSMARIDDRIRLTIQLIDGPTASHLMSTTLESPVDSVDRLLVELPEAAARLLRRRLGDWVRLQEMRTAATSTRAVELVQRAEPLIQDARAVEWNDLEASLPLLERADSMLAEAERLDPRWPEPAIMRAEVAEARALATAPVPTQYEPGATRTALDHLNRVLEQWQDYPPALAKRGNLNFGLAQSGFGDEDQLLDLYDRAEADLRRAVLLDPALSEGWWGLSKLLLHMNQYAEARRTAVRAVESDAFLTGDMTNLWHVFLVSFDAEDHPAARTWCDEIGELQAQQYPHLAHHEYCELYLLNSSPLVDPDVDRAWAMAEAIVAKSDEAGRDVYRGYTALQVAKVIVRAGMADSARAVARRSAPDPLPDWAPYDLAHVHLLLGDDDRALDVLEQWFEWNPVRAKRMARDWWFRRLHGHPRFEKLLGVDQAETPS